MRRALAATLLLPALLLSACGGGGGSPPDAGVPPETAGLPTATAPSAIAAGALRFGLDTPAWSGDLRVSVANPLDGSLRTLHDLAPADLGFASITAVQAEPLHRFVYVRAALPSGLNGADQLFVAPFDSATGRLGTPVLAGAGSAVPDAFTPDGQFAYVGNGDAGIRGFRVAADGRLTELPGSPFASDLRAGNLRMHPSGRWLFAPSAGTHTQDTAVFYGIDAQTGALAPVPAGVAPADLGFLALQGTDRVWWQHQRGQPYALYTFDTASGALAPVVPAVTLPDLGDGVRDMHVIPDPASDRLLTERPLADPFASELQAWQLGPDRNSVATAGAPLSIRMGAVTADPVGGLFRSTDIVLRIDPAQGVQLAAVSPVPLVSARIAVGAPAQVSDLSFAIDAAAHRLRTLAIDPDSGALAQVGSAMPLPGTPTALAVSPRIDFVAVTSTGSTGSGTLSVFRVDRTTAALTLSATAATGTSPMAVTVPPTQANHLLVAHAGGIDSFELRQDGTLARVAGSPFPPGFGPSTVTTNPDGSTTTVEGEPLHGLAPADLLALDRGALFVAANQGSQGGVSTLYVQPATGALDPLHTGNHVCTPLTQRTGSTFTPTGSGAVALGMAGSSRWIYVVNRESGTISGFLGSEQPPCGQPDPWVPVMDGMPFATLPQPVGIAVGQAGRYAYVANASGNGSVSAYAIDAATGALSPVSGSTVALGVIPTRIWTDIFGRFLYTAEAGGRVMVQTIDRATGVPGVPRPAADVPIANMAVDVVLSVH